MIRAVLFDMDGTVFDSEQIYRRGWVWAFRQVGGKGDLIPRLPYVSGMNHGDIGRYFHREFGEDFPYEEMMEYRTQFINRTIEAEGLPNKPFVPEIFGVLREMGLRVALVTSTRPERVNKFLDLSDLRSCFDCIVMGDRVEHSKPQPDIYLLGAREVGCRPEECVVAEDSRNGIYAGYRARMRVVMIPDLQPVTDEVRPMIWHVCRTLEELPALIEEENRRLMRK